MGGKSGPMDSLNSLLSDLGGVEGSILSRPKTLGGMKKTRAALTNPEIEKISEEGSAVNDLSTSASPFPSQSPWGSGANLDGLGHSSHSVDALDNLVRHEGPLNAQEQPSISNDANRSYTDWSFSELDISAAPLETPVTQEERSFDPFADFTAETSPPASAADAIAEDPLSMFGGTPVPKVSKFLPGLGGNSNATTRESRAADFFEAECPVQGRPETAVSVEEETAAPRRPSHRAFEYIDSYDNSSDTAASTAALSSSSRFHLRNDPDELTGSRPLTWNAKPEGDNDTNNSHRPPSSSGTGANTRYGGAILGSKESVAELGHRAAKALQIGTKWFMSTSKQIARDVHAKIDHHRHKQWGHHISYAGNNHGGKDSAAVPGFYYDWASQLSRMSPDSRAAALGAMDEGDRMEVQRIIDEAELGDAVLADPVVSAPGAVGPETDGRTSGKRAVCSDIPPPLPSYDEVVQHPPPVERHMERTQAPPEDSPPSWLQQQETVEVSIGGLGPLEVDPTFKGEPIVDLLGIHEEGIAGGDALLSASSSNGLSSTSHIDAMFSEARPPRPRQSSQRERQTPATSSQLPPTTIDLQGSKPSAILPSVDTSEFSQLYAASDEDAGTANAEEDEPEIRRILRQRRIAEKHERMMRQLAEKRAREKAEDAEKAGKVAYRETLRPRIDAWTSGRKDNIRALLSTLHTVLWEGSGWTRPSIADMVETSKVKRWYMKANLVVHPDKVKQKGGTLEQVATADMVFDVLKSAWGKFETLG